MNDNHKVHFALCFEYTDYVMYFSHLNILLLKFVSNFQGIKVNNSTIYESFPFSKRKCMPSSFKKC